MRRLACFILLIVVGGCTEDAPQTSPSAASSAAAPVITAAPKTQPVEAVGLDAQPMIPEGAQYSLYCFSVTTPTHVPDSDNLKEQLVKTTGSSNWYVLHEQGQSTLYYGFYKTFSDPAQPEETARAQADRKYVCGLRDNVGNLPFARAFFVPLSSPDPSAPPEWDLRNATGVWTLQIAAYTGSPDRKKYAVDAVREARAQGIEAYYYHGPAMSGVYIGSWPKEAVKVADEAKSTNPNQPLVVLPQAPPPGMDASKYFARNGQPAQVVAPHLEVEDPTLLAVMKQYPENAVNGEVQTHKVKTDNGVVEVPDPSVIIAIPHDEGQGQ